MKRLMWIASYPKSGNTWLRVFLANFLRQVEGPVPINSIGFVNAAACSILEKETGIISTELSMKQSRRVRLQVYRHLASKVNETVFLKIHDAYWLPEYEEGIVPEEVTLGVVYIVRNPLDVVVSYAHHEGLSIDETVAVLGETKYTLGFAYPRTQLPQRLGTWSEHVLSWLDKSKLPTCLIRYEDLHEDPINTFSRLLEFAGHQVERDRVIMAIEFSNFSELKRQERDFGFREQSFKNEEFFRKGKTGEWKEKLSPAQVKGIVTAHEHVMQRMGYLDDIHPM